MSIVVNSDEISFFDDFSYFPARNGRV